jgi:hypothetical protein
MQGTFNCPTCGAPLKYSGEGETVPCPYCNNSVIVPQALRPRTPEGPIPAAQSVPRLTPMQLDVIKDFLRQGKKLEAIKVYRQATLVDLKDAKALVEAIQADDPELKKRPQRPKPAGSKIWGKITGLLYRLTPGCLFPRRVRLWYISCRVRVWYIGKEVRWQAEPSAQSTICIRPNDPPEPDSANAIIHEQPWLLI